MCWHEMQSYVRKRVRVEINLLSPLSYNSLREDRLRSLRSWWLKHRWYRTFVEETQLNNEYLWKLEAENPLQRKKNRTIKKFPVLDCNDLIITRLILLMVFLLEFSVKGVVSSTQWALDLDRIIYIGYSFVEITNVLILIADCNSWKSCWRQHDTDCYRSFKYCI